MGNPIGNKGFPYVIELVEYILRIVIMPQYEGVIDVRWAVLRGEILENPDGQDIEG